LILNFDFPGRHTFCGRKLNHNSKFEIQDWVRPMQHGGAKHHRERMEEALREEIGAIVEGELADPRIGLASVSRVQLAPDGRSAHVNVAVEGSELEVARSLEGLNAARPYIRRELISRLHLRQAPELFFELDRSSAYDARIEELLGRIKKQNR
jgi:ribosome-binding factor A